jgi:GNAT superfamily N-acetyltransferase
MNDKNKLSIVSCTGEYWEFIRQLRMDPRVISGFVKTTPITPAMQSKYMKYHANDYRIALLDGIPVGFVGVIEGDIRVCTHPEYQGIGIGKFMIKECIKVWPNAFAKIKINNEASIKLFQNCGFKKKYVILEKD